MKMKESMKWLIWIMKEANEKKWWNTIIWKNEIIINIQ